MSTSDNISAIEAIEKAIEGAELAKRECVFAAQEARKANGTDTYSSRVLDKASTVIGELAANLVKACAYCGGDTGRYDFDPLGCACPPPAGDLRRHAMVFDGEEGWTMLPDPDGEYLKFEDVAAMSTILAEARKAEAMEREIAELIELLMECEEYFDNRSDADCDQDGFVPNKEMVLLSKVKAALKPSTLTKTGMTGAKHYYCEAESAWDGGKNAE